jgi:hypothetical protein
MNVIERTATRLVLQARGAGIGLIAIGLLFAMVGLITFLLFSQVVELECSRDWQDHACQINRSLFGLPLSSKPVRSLVGAYVDESEDSDGSTYRVVLQGWDQLEVPLTNSYSSGYRDKARVVEEVETFIANPAQRTLQVTQDTSWGWLLSGIFVVMGLATSFMGTQTMKTFWIFDKGVNLLTKERRGTLATETVTYPLDKIVRAEVGAGSEGDTFRVEICMRDLERVPLTGFYSSGRRKKEETALIIREFLDL